MPGYSIVSERPIRGFDQFGKGEAVAMASDLLDELAESAGVRPLIDFFSMDPEELDSIFDGLELEPDPEGTGEIAPEDDPRLDETPPEEWFDAEEGLTTVRALIQAVQTRPPAEVPDPYEPTPEEILADLHEFETVLDHLAAEGIRWHLLLEF